MALNSPEVSQGVAAAAMALEAVRSAGAAETSLAVAVSVAKTARSGVAKSAGDWWSRVVVTFSMVALMIFDLPGYGNCARFGEGNSVVAPAASLRPAAARKRLRPSVSYETQG